jgi:hypothetical protein
VVASQLQQPVLPKHGCQYRQLLTPAHIAAAVDLAAEEGWPKDKLRTKIDAIRRERKDIRTTLDQAETQMDNGRQVFRDALTLLEDPQAMYEHGNETVRSILNKAFFTKLYVDGRKVVNHQLNEPFDIISEAYHGYRTSKTYHRRDTAVQTSNSAVLANEYGAVDRETHRLAIPRPCGPRS